jgi:His/Glu/Gln/Arg/opine family amino acid ABC transporter permease subunit
MLEWMPELLIRFSDRLIDGTLITIKLVFLACVSGLILALPLALARSAKSIWYVAPAWSYIYLFRGTPLLIQLFLVYYGLSQFESIRNSVIWPLLSSAEWCGWLVLTLNTAAYTAEIIRGGINGVPHGEVEAARASGMGYLLIHRRIILPRAMRIAWPAYGNEVILLLKGSALLSTIAVWDLMGETRSVFSRTYSLEIFIYAALLYMLLTFLLTRLFRRIEFRLNRYLTL